MSFLELLRTAIEGLSAHKLRSGLSILGVVIGVAAVVAIVTMLEGAATAVKAEFLEFLNPQIITIEQGSFFATGVFEFGFGDPELKEAELETALAAQQKAEKLFTVGFAQELEERAPAIRKVVPMIETTAMLSLDHRSESRSGAQIVGTTPEYAELLGVEISRGRFLQPEDITQARPVVILDEGTARHLYPRQDPIGLSVTLMLMPQVFQLGEEPPSPASLQAVIVGLVHRGQAFMPLTTLQHLIGKDSVDRYLAEAARLAWVEEGAKQLRFVLARRLGVPVEVVKDWISTPREELEAFQEVTRILMLVLGGIAAISLLVGGIGIMNVMLVSVVERTREIGIRKAVGARRRDILIQFLSESAMMSLLGGLIGLGLGWGLAWIGAQVGDWAFILSSLPAAVALATSTIVGLSAGFYPALRAAGLDSVEALRYE